MADINYTFDMGSGRSSVHLIEMTVPKASWDEFFAKLEKFGKENNLEVYIRNVKEGVDRIFIDMWRSDIAMHGGNTLDVDEYDLSFYIDPDKGGTAEKVMELASELKRVVSGVPDLKFKSPQ